MLPLLHLVSSLEVCKPVGGKISIAPEHLAQFSQAPPWAKLELSKLEAQHEEQFSKLLEHLSKNESGQEEKEDPRTHEQELKPPATNLIEFESLDALKAHTKLSEEECFVSGDRKVKMLKDATSIYFFCAGEDHTCRKHTLAGSFGSGQVVERDPQPPLGAIPWSLPEGDRTVIQLVHGAGGADDDAEAKSKTADVETKPILASVYQCLKPLLHQAAVAAKSVPHLVGAERCK